MTVIDWQNLNVCCTAQKLSKIKDFLAFAFAKKQSKMKKSKGAKVVRNELVLRSFFAIFKKSTGFFVIC